MTSTHPTPTAAPPTANQGCGTDPFPLTPLQQGYFVGEVAGLELSYPTAHHYYDLGLVDIDPYDAHRSLQDAVDRLALRQEMLRARALDDGTQVVLPYDAPGAIPQVTLKDARTFTPDAVRDLLDATAERMRREGPDPRTGPPLQLHLTLLPDGRGRLHTSTSLMIIDGWAANLFYRELFTLLRDWNAALPPLRMTYRQYLEAVDARADSPQVREDRRWWHEQLPTLPSAPAMPLTADPADVDVEIMGARSHRLDPKTWDAVREQCRAHGVTPTVALLTVFAAGMSALCDQTDLLVNTLQANRLNIHPDVDRIVGGFATTMLIPVRLTPGATLTQQARAARTAMGMSMSHASVSAVEVTRDLGRLRGTRRPLAPVVFLSTLGVESAMGSAIAPQAGALGQIDFGDHRQELRTPQVAFETRCFEVGEGAQIEFALVEEIFDEAVIDGLFDRFVTDARGLATPQAWDDVPLIGSRPEPSGSGLRLARYPEASAETGPVDASGAEPDEPCRPGLEERLADIWRTVCDLDVTGRHTQFFAAGGDSLVAVRMLAAVARTEGVRVSTRDFMDAPTLAGLADLVERGRDGSSAPASVERASARPASADTGARAAR